MYSDLLRCVWIHLNIVWIIISLNTSEYIWSDIQMYSDIFRCVWIYLNIVWILINLNTSEYILSEYSDVFRFIKMCLNTSEYRLNLNKSKYIWINLIFLVQIFLDLFRFIQTRSKSWRLNNFFQTYSDQIQTYSDRFLGKGEIKIYSDQFRCHFPLVKVKIVPISC